ncbi:uncharacterized protein DUF3995 [Scopulibacillus darangshiensis]|uniref:Uncharacterized protein DUF3995 n=1 Tax=Scopulibacillus darangshiensis TaxID=442528 RepID=A0A4V6NQN3_9BACL|nr:DUF3995 domain-containing protein [Scopulibacillus darangshiensis]TCP28866.1 uncharacterized protein DUF3995 [Scopulibacillus darangshiensis]
MLRNKKLYIFAGSIWCFVFALMSFYWASGGMIGARSLGGLIYEKALEKEPSFTVTLWLTGLIKLCGGLFLLLFLKEWPLITNRILRILAIAGGIFLFVYGLSNLITLLLSSFGLLTLQIDKFALWWRLLFWEPFWMLGGILFILSAVKFKKHLKVEKNFSGK